MACTAMFTAILLRISKTQKQPKCSSIPERILSAYAHNRIHTATTKKGLLWLAFHRCDVAWKRPGPKEHGVWLHLYEVREWIEWFWGDSRALLSLGERELPGRCKCSRWRMRRKLQMCIHLLKFVKLYTYDLCISPNYTLAKGPNQSHQTRMPHP